MFSAKDLTHSLSQMVLSGSLPVDASSSPSLLASHASRITQGASRTVNERTVHLPDLFSSIMAIKPAVNPNYHEVKAKGNSWVIKYVHIRNGPCHIFIHFAFRAFRVDDEWAARFSMIEFPYMCSMWAPYCDEDHLQLVVDWNNWVRVYIQC